MRTIALLLLALLMHQEDQPREVSLEYRVKAVYLFNFIKFIEWPSLDSRPLTICVAEPNPFGDVLAETVRGEWVNNRPVATRVIAAPDSACRVLFVPQDVPARPYLQAARAGATVTVGESADFIKEGGIVNFILENGKVRFEIDSQAAKSAEFRISSHLMRLARIPSGKGQP